MVAPGTVIAVECEPLVAIAIVYRAWQSRKIMSTDQPRTPLRKSVNKAMKMKHVLDGIHKVLLMLVQHYCILKTNSVYIP